MLVIRSARNLTLLFHGTSAPPRSTFQDLDLGPAHRTRPVIEFLEGRQLLSTFTVTNTGDTGAGSFRDAITQVNADTQPGIDTINFAIGSGVQTIHTPVRPADDHALRGDRRHQPAGFRRHAPHQPLWCGHFGQWTDSYRR